MNPHLGLAAPAAFQLQQRQQLECLHLVGLAAQQLLQLTLGASQVILFAAQFSQQQPQVPALGLLLHKSFHQGGGLRPALQTHQQLQ